MSSHRSSHQLKNGNSDDLRPLPRPPQRPDEPRPGQYPSFPRDRGLSTPAVRGKPDRRGSRQENRGASAGDRVGKLVLTATHSDLLGKTAPPASMLRFPNGPA